MFASLLRIGELVERRKGKGGLNVQKVKKVRGREECLGVVVFDNLKREVRLERRALTADAEEKYAYIGNASANRPQDRLTTNGLHYILGFDRKKKLLARKKFAVRTVAEMLHGTRAGDLLEEVLSWYSPESYADKLAGLDWNCSLYTVAVVDRSGELVEVATLKEYRDMLLRPGETVEGRCQFCGSDRVLKNPDYPDGTLLKIFVVDKMGFLPGLDRSEAVRAHSVCPECRRKLVAGDSYVEQNLVARVGPVNIYIIPDMPEDQTEEFLWRLRPDDEGWIIEGLNMVKERERDVQEIAEYSGIDPRLTLVAGRREQAKFRVWRVIPEVRYMRFVEVYRAFMKAASAVGLSRERYPVFSAMYSALPVGETEGDYRVFIEFLEAVIQGNPLDEGYVYRTFLSKLRCLRYGTCSGLMNESLEEMAMEQETLIYMMRDLGVMGSPAGGERQPAAEDDVLAQAERLGLNGGLKGLFLLGVLTAYVGKEQHEKGDSKKSILDKIDFEGMDYGDLIAFSNRLLEALRDYGQLNSYTESLFASALELIKGDAGSLGNPQVNTFHLLLGYSYMTRRFIEHGARAREAPAEEGAGGNIY